MLGVADGCCGHCRCTLPDRLAVSCPFSASSFVVAWSSCPACLTVKMTRESKSDRALLKPGQEEALPSRMLNTCSMRSTAQTVYNFSLSFSSSTRAASCAAF
jgi:hypothetical protein